MCTFHAPRFPSESLQHFDRGLFAGHGDGDHPDTRGGVRGRLPDSSAESDGPGRTDDPLDDRAVCRDGAAGRDGDARVVC